MPDVILEKGEEYTLNEKGADSFNLWAGSPVASVGDTVVVLWDGLSPWSRLKDNVYKDYWSLDTEDFAEFDEQ